MIIHMPKNRDALILTNFKNSSQLRSIQYLFWILSKEITMTIHEFKTTCSSFKIPEELHFRLWIMRIHDHKGKETGGMVFCLFQKVFVCFIYSSIFPIFCNGHD